MSIERLVPDKNDNYGTVEHLHRYALAMELCKNKVVLDIASGDGYGSNLLASVASKVTGVDISREEVENANKKYKRSNLQYIHGSATEIPLQNGAVDVIVSFETIEHLIEQEQMMKEFKRVLKPEGILIISSPAKEYYSLKNPDNPYHLKELTTDELMDLVKTYFSHCEFLYQRIVTGTIISKDRNAGFQGSFDSAKYFEGDKDKIVNGTASHKFDIYNIPFFVVAVCSNAPVKDVVPALSFFDASSAIIAIIEQLKGSIDGYQNSRVLKVSKKLKQIFKIG